MPVSPFTTKRLAQRLRKEVVGQPLTEEELRAKCASIMEELLKEILVNRKPKEDFTVITTANPEQQAQGIIQVDIEFRRDSLLGQAYLRNVEKQNAVPDS